MVERGEAETGALSGKLSGTTRRSFIRGIAAAGASTLTLADVATARTAFHPRARVARGNAFSRFEAIAPSAADAFEVPDGFRADVLISWGDTFVGEANQRLRYGFNNDFLAYFPLDGSDEGILFVNHEYPSPFFLYGYAGRGVDKSPAQIAIEQEAVGNSLLHVRRGRRGYRVVSPSQYNRRIYGDRPRIEFTGPLEGSAPVGRSANGSLANCSGGITPWGTAISCEENYASYGQAVSAADPDRYGWNSVDPEYDPVAFAKYGWVVEHDPYDPSDSGRKHTALGRFRHENTAFRQVPGKRFVLYMGDDQNNQGVYKFVSARSYRKGRDANNRKILEDGKLYIARWEPEGRRRFANAGDIEPLTPTEGTGRWVEVPTEDLIDTAARLRARSGTAEFETHYATNRPEDVEVAGDGSLFIALSNNTTVKDSHGSVRRLREGGGDPEATTFSWEDYASGGPSGRDGDGEGGFSSPDNLAFDRAGDLWVMTDISSARLNKDNEYRYHANNAVFHVPTSGPNAGVAFRFANMPIEAEGTGPYFSPDERALFVNVQHPGEETPGGGGVFDSPSTYTSWWPRGDKTAGRRPSTPRPSTVVIYRER